jgi:hypothetical protein
MSFYFQGFFKRSILRKEKYRCYFDNTCLINVTNRNRCKSCRFRRCIDEGMSVDGKIQSYIDEERKRTIEFYLIRRKNGAHTKTS